MFFFFFCSISVSFADPGSQGALDLTELIGVPLPPSVSFVTGFEGYPAYSFGPDANVGRLTKSFIPDPFYHDFAVTVTAKPTTRRGGVLFAITDAYQKVIDIKIHCIPMISSTNLLFKKVKKKIKNVYISSFFLRLYTWV